MLNNPGGPRAGWNLHAAVICLRLAHCILCLQYSGTLWLLRQHRILLYKCFYAKSQTQSNWDTQSLLCSYSFFSHFILIKKNRHENFLILHGAENIHCRCRPGTWLLWFPLALKELAAFTCLPIRWNWTPCLQHPRSVCGQGRLPASRGWLLDCPKWAPWWRKAL